VSAAEAAEDDLARRRSLLTAALGFALVDTKGKPASKEVQLVREWLDNWKGIGHVVTGMARQDYGLEPLGMMAAADARWRCVRHLLSRPRSSR